MSFEMITVSDHKVIESYSGVSLCESARDAADHTLDPDQPTCVMCRPTLLHLAAVTTNVYIRDDSFMKDSEEGAQRTCGLCAEGDVAPTGVINLVLCTWLVRDNQMVISSLKYNEPPFLFHYSMFKGLLVGGVNSFGNPLPPNLSDVGLGRAVSNNFCKFT